MFANVVYILCAATSALCAVLLLRGYMTTRTRLLFWSGLCFVGLTLNNVMLVIDERVFPTIDLSLWRTIPALIGVWLLVWGLVWETR